MRGRESGVVFGEEAVEGGVEFESSGVETSESDESFVGGGFLGNGFGFGRRRGSFDGLSSRDESESGSLVLVFLGDGDSGGSDLLSSCCCLPIRSQSDQSFPVQLNLETSLLRSSFPLDPSLLSHVLGGNESDAILGELTLLDGEHLGDVDDDVGFLAGVAGVEVAFEFGGGELGGSVGVGVRVKHLGDSNGLGDLRRRDDFDDGLEGGGGEREPLRHDEVEEGSVILGPEVSRVKLDAERGNDLVDLVRVAGEERKSTRPRSALPP